MYTGNHPDATAKIHEIQNKGRTKSSPLDHIALPLTFFFMVTDLMTVHLYTESLFDERPEMAMLVAASISRASWTTCCPVISGRRSTESAHFWVRPSEPLQSLRASASCPR